MPSATGPILPTADDLRASFDAAPAFTVGLEEEVWVLDPQTFEVAPRAAEVLSRLPGDGRFVPEMPATQFELVMPPAHTVEEGVAFMAAARAEVSAACGEEFAFASVGVFPTAPAEAPLSTGARYERIGREYGIVARRQLVSALHVHVAIPGSELALAVYNGLRNYLPELSALAAHSPFHAGMDTGFVSVRPTLATMLPRQGLPPHLNSWDELAMAYQRLGDAAAWWWEMRPHPRHGTLEIRVPDAQPSLADVARVASACVTVAKRVAERGGGPIVADWQLSENRWSALRDGLNGKLQNLETGELRSTRDALEELGIEAPADTPADRLRAVGLEGAGKYLATQWGHV